MRRFLHRFLAVGGLLFFVPLGTALAGSQYFRSEVTSHPVTTTADSGPGSLRNAIDASGNGDVVYFDFALNGQTITLTSGELAINASITIAGPGANLLTVSKDQQAPPFRIFHVLPGHTDMIQGLTIRGGNDNGGGIRNDQSALTINNCTILANVSPDSGYGGGIYNNGSGGSATLTIVNSTITGNRAYVAGGGIYNGASKGGSATVSLWNSSVSDNIASYFMLPFGGGAGGGIANDGAGASVTLTNSIVNNNHAGVPDPFPVGTGGGISNHGTLTIITSTINGNQCWFGGGGIDNGGTLTIISSTVSGNMANGLHDGEGWGDGAGIANAGSLTITNSTLSNNSSTRAAGGVGNRGLVTVIHSTLSGNTAIEGGSIANNNSATLEIGNTILKTGGPGANIFNNGGTVTSHGYNLSSDDGGGFLNAIGDQINTDPILGPLQNNGGPTFTHDLLTGSPAINAGDPNFTPPPFEDQRGYLRVFNGRVDIGSLEAQPVATPSPSPTPSPTPCGLVTTLSENFDGVTAPALPPGWVSAFTPGPANCTPTGTCALGTNWITTTNGPNTPPHCAFHNAPGCVTDSTLDTPFFEGRVTNGTFLFFRHSFDLENGRDGAVLEISIDGGPFIDFVAAGGGNPGYNGTISTAFLSPIAGRSAWTGNSGGYVDVNAQMPPGHNVRLRFRLATDCSGSATGWRIDNIRVEDNIGCESPTPTPSPPSPTPTATATGTPLPSPARTLNLSTRMLVQTGDGVGIGGFIITGPVPKQVLLRAIGPSLGQVGVPDPLADPVMELHGPAGFTTIINDNWRDTQEPQIIATGLPPNDDLESAILVTLDPGPYTAIVKGKNNTSGVGLVEVYDLEQVANSQLANISTRAFVGTDAHVTIGGFILGGGDNAHILIRALGPSLGGLADPTLELRDGNGVLLASNDNCEGSSLPPPDPLEACIDITLPSGLYTAILAGKNGGTGIGLIEIYNVQ